MHQFTFKDRVEAVERDMIRLLSEIQNIRKDLLSKEPTEAIILPKGEINNLIINRKKNLRK